MWERIDRMRTEQAKGDVYPNRIDAELEAAWEAEAKRRGVYSAQANEGQWNRVTAFAVMPYLPSVCVQTLRLEWSFRSVEDMEERDTLVAAGTNISYYAEHSPYVMCAEVQTERGEELEPPPSSDGEWAEVKPPKRSRMRDDTLYVPPEFRTYEGRICGYEARVDTGSDDTNPSLTIWLGADRNVSGRIYIEWAWVRDVPRGGEWEGSPVDAVYVHPMRDRVKGADGVWRNVRLPVQESADFQVQCRAIQSYARLIELLRAHRVGEAWTRK